MRTFQELRLDRYKGEVRILGNGCSLGTSVKNFFIFVISVKILLSVNINICILL